MDRGFNPTLAISLFEAADVTTAIINGQLASDESQAKMKTRMGYMGHLTLIAEEVVKFTERHPPELLSDTVMERVMSQDWINYVEGALAETRERDNAILGGVRPEVAMGNRPGMNSNGLAAAGLSGLGSALGLGGSSQSGSGSNALAEAGLNGGMDMHEGSGNGIGQFAISAGPLMSGFGSSSDEDEDEVEDNDEDVNNEVSHFFFNHGRNTLSPDSNKRTLDHYLDEELFEEPKLLELRSAPSHRVNKVHRYSPEEEVLGGTQEQTHDAIDDEDVEMANVGDILPESAKNNLSRLSESRSR
jgi:hypothetical protein